MAVVTSGIAQAGGEAFTSIAAWLTATNLNADTDIWHGEIRDNNEYDETLTVSVSGTSATSHVRLTAAAANRHDGTYDTGAARINDTSTATSAITVTGNWFHIEGLIVARTGGGPSDESIRVSAADNFQASRCVFYSEITAAHADGIYFTSNASGSIDNSAFWNWTRSAIHSQSNTGTINVDYVTAVLCGGHSSSDHYGILAQAVSGTGTFNVYNSIFMDNIGSVGTDTEIGNDGAAVMVLNGSHNITTGTSATYIDTDLTNNLTDHISATGGLVETDVASAVIITENTPDATFDARLRNFANNVAFRAGVNRIGSEPDPRQDFSTDIAGNPRGSTHDIGAFQAPAISVASATPPITQTRGSTTTGVITTAAFTPVADSVLVVTAQSFHDGHTSPFDWSITDSAGLTWNLIDESADVEASGTTFDTRIIAWWAAVGPSPSSMTITIDPRAAATDNQDFGSGINVAQITGDVDTAAPIAQHDIAASTAGTETATLPSAPLGLCLAATFCVTGSSASGSWPAAPANWTEVSGSATDAIQNPSRLLTADAEQAITFTFTATGGLGHLGFIYEIAEPPPSGGGAAFEASGSAALSVSATATALHTFEASGSGGATAGASATGLSAFEASGSAGLSATASGSAVATFEASGSAALTPLASASGLHTLEASGSASLAGATSGSALHTFEASGSAGLSASAAVGSAATFEASGSAALSASVSASALHTFEASGSGDLAGSASTAHTATFEASGSAALTMTPSATALHTFEASGSAGLTATGSAGSAVGFAASGSAGLAATASGSALHGLDASGSALLSTSATATALHAFNTSGSAGLSAVAAALASGVGAIEILDVGPVWDITDVGPVWDIVGAMALSIVDTASNEEAWVDLLAAVDPSGVAVEFALSTNVDEAPSAGWVAGSWGSWSPTTGYVRATTPTIGSGSAAIPATAGALNHLWARFGGSGGTVKRVGAFRAR